ncbi:MAG: HD domain-containing protein, partial [Bdellovibrionales bacterium]|nr:HD domain-containing protein [Bdellovibrionales bacterium]
MAVSGREVLALLASREPEYCGFFINPKVSIPYGIAVFRACRTQFPRVPLYALLDQGESLQGEAEFKDLGFSGVMNKPVTYRDMIREVRPDLVEYESVARSPERGSTGADEEENAVDLGADAFLPILAKDFLSGSVSQFDVFVQLGPSRFLKILRSGDAFDSARVESYLSKGVTHFFVRREDQIRLLEFTGTVAAAVIGNKTRVASMDIGGTASLALTYGDQVLKHLLGERGKNQVEYARKFAKSLESLAPRLQRAAAGTELPGVIDRMLQHDHSVAISMMASLFAREMQFDSDSALLMVGVACLLHDVALLKNFPELAHEDESRMSDAERIRFRSHPQKGAQYLRTMKGVIPEGVLQAVEQHHERRDGSGFPNGMSGGSIQKVAEIIGVSEDLVRAYE